MTIKETTIYDFKTNLSRYISALKEGKYTQITVKNRNDPVIDVKIHEPPKKNPIQWGIMRGKFKFDKGLFDTADEDIIEDFENSDIFPKDRH